MRATKRGGADERDLPRMPLPMGATRRVYISLHHAGVHGRAEEYTGAESV